MIESWVFHNKRIKCPKKERKKEKKKKGRGEFKV